MEESSDPVRDHIPSNQSKVFLCHSGVQKDIVEQLCSDLETRHRFPFFDKRRTSIPLGEEFPNYIFNAISTCKVGVLILSKEFFTNTKWPMVEFVTMVREYDKPNSSIRIVPVYFFISREECRDPETLRIWRLQWKIWAKTDKRINVNEWERALRMFDKITGLTCKNESSQSKVREMIVEEICKMTPPEINWDLDHIQGKGRICEAICKFIKRPRLSANSTVRVVGLYGMSGIGKTTVCGVLCDKFSDQYGGRVCHVELKSATEEALLQKVLRAFENYFPEKWATFQSASQYRSNLKTHNFKPFFLAIDNVSDDKESDMQANAFLNIKRNTNNKGVVILTARSLDHLKHYVDESDCLEMPDLNVDEARLVFLHHVACKHDDTRNEIDEGLILGCVQRCRFLKGEDGSFHYHPLALEVLGRQLRPIRNSVQWAEQLHDIDTFNKSRKTRDEHPVFAIFDRCFQALKPEDQLLFMDAAIFIPTNNRRANWNGIQWLGMVHRKNEKDVEKVLRTLKEKSLVRSLDSGFMRIGIHDLWREFCEIRMTVGEYGDRSWKCEEKNHMMRTIIPTNNLKPLHGVVFKDYFCGLTVLKLECRIDFLDQELDFSGLKLLRSLDIEPVGVTRDKALSVTFGSTRTSSAQSLVFLNLTSLGAPTPCIKDIGLSMTNLQYLQLHSFRGSKFPDVSKLTSLQVICFRHSRSVTTIFGLGSQLTNLQILDLDYCSSLTSCPNLGDLVALQRLLLAGCTKLEALPNLERLKNLQMLIITGCPLIRTLQGVGDLVALQMLRAAMCYKLAELPDLQKLTNLQVLCLRDCPLKVISGLGHLRALQEFWIGLKEPQDGFALHLEVSKLSNLQKLDLELWGSEEWNSVVSLVQLKAFSLCKCLGTESLIDLQKMTSLQTLVISQCEFQDMSGVCNLIGLEDLAIRRCNKLSTLPDMSYLTSLKSLEVTACHGLTDLDAVSTLSSLDNLALKELLLDVLPSLQRLMGLMNLNLFHSRFSNLDTIACLPHLHLLNCNGLPITELPDLKHFTGLTELKLRGCEQLVSLTISKPLAALEELVLSDTPVTVLPDLSNFPQLRKLDVSDCLELNSLTSSGTIIALEVLEVRGCRTLEALPDLRCAKDLRWLSMRNSNIEFSQEERNYIKELNTCLTLDVDLNCSGGSFMQDERLANEPEDCGTLFMYMFDRMWYWWRCTC